jgi:hypothetical protein
VVITRILSHRTGPRIRLRGSRITKWWEILPAGYVGVGEHATAGQPFEIETYYKGSKKYNFWFYNYWDASYWSEEVTTTSGIDMSTSDFIVERPHINGKFTPLADFGNIEMEGFTDAENLANHPYNVGTMYSKETELASASGIPPSSHIFTDTWRHCGTEEE